MDAISYVDEVLNLLEPRMSAMVDRAVKSEVDRKREVLLAAVVTGLASKWDGESAQKLAELSERLTDAVMREELKRKLNSEIPY